jgi:creatinine amidohydrolase
MEVKVTDKTYDLDHATLKHLTEAKPDVAILPWGATEAHNYHLPHTSDVIQARDISKRAAEKAWRQGARVIVLPTVPFGNNAQQLDQVTTIHLSTSTAMMVLSDVVHSLVKQNLDRLILVNAHGGNNFKPLIRDVQSSFPVLITLVNLYEMLPELVNELFEEPGDHAGELETSMMMYLTGNKIDLSEAGSGNRVPFKLTSFSRPGVWTPRPWRHSHPDTGSGNPEKATYEKGKRYVEGLTQALSEVMVEISKARKGDIPYI